MASATWLFAAAAAFSDLWIVPTSFHVPSLPAVAVAPPKGPPQVHKGSVPKVVLPVAPAASRPRAAAPSARVAERPSLVLIDGHALAYRMHFGLQKSRRTRSDGAPSHALHGFLMRLLDIHKMYPQHQIVVAFDLPGRTFRSNMQSSYKQQRSAMPLSLRPQIDAMREACRCLGIPAVSAKGFEADDVIATYVAKARDAGVASVVIVATDKDLTQLVSEEGEATEVIMWNDQKKEVVDAAAVKAKYGVRPSQMADRLALTGDASDNVHGVPGIRPKVAAKLIAFYGSLENVLAAARTTMKPSERRQALLEFAETARQARSMIDLRTDAPVDNAVASRSGLNLGSQELIGFLRRWGLSLVEARVRDLGESMDIG